MSIERLVRSRVSSLAKSGKIKIPCMVCGAKSLEVIEHFDLPGQFICADSDECKRKIKHRHRRNRKVDDDEDV